MSLMMRRDCSSVGFAAKKLSQPEM